MFFCKIKWSFPQRRVHYVQYQYFYFTFFLFAYTLNAPPAAAYGLDQPPHLGRSSRPTVTVRRCRFTHGCSGLGSFRRLRNDLFCVDCDVKHYSVHAGSFNVINQTLPPGFRSLPFLCPKLCTFIPHLSATFSDLQQYLVVRIMQYMYV